VIPSKTRNTARGAMLLVFEFFKTVFPGLKKSTKIGKTDLRASMQIRIEIVSDYLMINNCNLDFIVHHQFPCMFKNMSSITPRTNIIIYRTITIKKNTYFCLPF
jgi:hypothetical protein